MHMPRYAASDPEVALLPPWWAPHRDDERAVLDRVEELRGVRPKPWLGTDALGRDLLARCLLGGAISLGVGIIAATIAMVIGTLFGSIAAFTGGKIDAIMMRAVDVMYGLPSVLLVVLLAVAVEGLGERGDVVFPQENTTGHPVGTSATVVVEPPAWARLLQDHRTAINLVTLVVAIGGVSWLTLARVVRGQVLSLKAQPFMEACRTMGMPWGRQFTRHLLPNLIGPVIVYGTLAVPAAILAESFLSFLGIGVHEPVPSWGNLAAAGQGELNPVRSRWWLLAWPCVLLAVTLISLSVAGERMRVKFDPKGSGR